MQWKIKIKNGKLLKKCSKQLNCKVLFVTNVIHVNFLLLMSSLIRNVAQEFVIYIFIAIVYKKFNKYDIIITDAFYNLKKITFSGSPCKY